MPDEKQDHAPNEEKTPTLPPEEKISQTQHTITINGEVIQYTATAGTILLKEEDDETGEKPKASIFYVAYTRDGVEDPSNRPLTFSFNGGPGSSSVWLHLGLLGPKRVLMDEIGNPLPPPYQLVENEFSLLDKTDLVFIDPVSTGYSRAVPGEKAKQFHGFEKDIESVGEFIRMYATRNNRWLSPKFLIGESYGTTRASGLAGHLQERVGMYLNGIMLVSVVLNFQTIRFFVGNDMPYILFLPTYAATAWFHKKLSEDQLARPLDEFLTEVKAFAMGDYTLALMQGSALDAEQKAAIAEKLAAYTGLTPEYIEQTNFRLNIFRFTKELRRTERLTVGRLDSRFTGRDRDAAGEHFEFDPSYATIQGTYTATMNDYLRRELGFETDLPYEILTYRVHPWSYEKQQNHYLNVAETLRKAMSLNPHLKVFVANGYYDLATPYLATEYTFNHMDLEPEMMQNISMKYYEAGHMMYVHLASLDDMKTHLSEFIDASIA